MHILPLHQTVWILFLTVLAFWQGLSEPLSRVQPERAVAPLFPPTKPNSVPGALQQNMPLADVMDIISKPPGSTPPFIPYKPVPPLVPLPKRHTLPVARPHVLNDRSAFGEITEDPLQVQSLWVIFSPITDGCYSTVLVI